MLLPGDRWRGHGWRGGCIDGEIDRQIDRYTLFLWKQRCVYTYLYLHSARIRPYARQRLRPSATPKGFCPSDTNYLSVQPPPLRLGPPLSRSSSSSSRSSSSSSSTSSSSTSSSIILILIAVVLVRISSGSSIGRLLAVRVAVLISSPSDTPPPSDTNYLSI